jgi:hypothetical protein
LNDDNSGHPGVTLLKIVAGPVMITSEGWEKFQPNRRQKNFRHEKKSQVQNVGKIDHLQKF